jgi:hypothetical protein
MKVNNIIGLEDEHKKKKKKNRDHIKKYQKKGDKIDD